MSNDRTSQGASGRARQHAQERARRAWDAVDAVTRQAETLQKRYGTLARKLPSYLQASGLGQTLAFLHAKHEPSKTTAEGLLLDHLDNHLRGVLRRQGPQDIMALVLDLSPADYRRATRELMALATWLKRFAEGRLGREDD